MNLLDDVRTLIDQYLQPGRARSILLLNKRTEPPALEEWFPGADVRRDMAMLRDVIELQAVQLEDLRQELLSWANTAGRLTQERNKAQADVDLLLAALAQRDQDVVRLEAEIARLHGLICP